MNRTSLTRATFAVCLAMHASPATAAQLAPHRAYYDLSVSRLDKDQNITAITGKLAYEITGSTCEGFAVNYRIANRISYTEGGSQIIDTQMTSWESGDGLELDLTQKQFIDAASAGDTRIKVKKATATAVGKGALTGTEPKEFDVDAAAIFPTFYQIQLIQTAQKGESRNQALIYEGSENEKAMKAISFIGAKKPAPALASTGEKLDVSQMAAWPVSISYYATASEGDDQPIYQANFTMLENGVSADLVMDYGRYALAGKLTKLEMLKADDCK